MTAVPAILRSTTQAHKVYFVITNFPPIFFEAAEYMFININYYFLAVLNKLREKLSHLNLDYCDKITGENHVCGAFVG
jgi:hypothetical protein